MRRPANSLEIRADFDERPGGESGLNRARGICETSLLAEQGDVIGRGLDTVLIDPECRNRGNVEPTRSLGMERLSKFSPAVLFDSRFQSDW